MTEDTNSCISNNQLNVKETKIPQKKKKKVKETKKKLRKTSLW